MKSLKVTIAVFLLCCISVPIIMGSCDSGKLSSGTSTSSSNSGFVDNSGDDSKYSSVAPDADFKGASFNVAGVDPEIYNTGLFDFDFEEDQEDVVYASIFERNRIVESKYNIKFQSDYIGTYNECSNLFELNVSGDDNYYQLYMMVQRQSLNYVLEGKSMPAESIPYLDFSQPWYQDGMNQMFNINGIQLLCYTDTCMNSYMQTICLFFNSDIVRDRSDIDSPYDLVKNGTWTLENFYRLANTVKSDINGNGFSVDEDDIFGICGEHDGLYASMWMGAGLRAITVDSNDELQFHANGNEKFIGVIEELAKNLQNDGFFCNSYIYFSDISTDGDMQRRGGDQYFSEGKALFKIGGLGSIQVLRNMEADFGIVPLPKYNEEQEEYYTRTVDGWIYNVPVVSDQNLEMIGTIIDALGAESANYVKPAFFEKALENKYIRDEERETTLQMLELIFDSATIDLAETFLDCFSVPMWTVITEGKGNYSSSIAGLERRVLITLMNNQKKIDELASNIK